MTDPCYSEPNYTSCTPVNLIPSHCTAHFKCWECTQGWSARVMEKDIALAIALVQNLAAKLHNTSESVSHICEAVWLLQSLSNRQWREMTRQPFLFDSPLKQALAKPANTLTIDDLDLDL